MILKIVNINSMIKDPQIKKLIELLNANGYAVLSIDNELFIITNFYAAEGITTKHILTGKYITNINQNHLLQNLASSSVDRANKQATTYVQSLPTVKREWSDLVSWTTYIPA